MGATNSRRGTVGERATADSLTALPADTWTVLHDLPWPGRRMATIDHVAVGPAGVFVIDSLTWPGRVTTVDGVLLRNGRGRTQATRNAHAAALAVGSLLTSLSQERVVPVLCFLNGDVPDVAVDDVLVCSIVTVVHRLTSRPAVFAPDDVEAVASELRRRLPTATESRPAPAATYRPRARQGRSPKTVVAVVAGVVLAIGLATSPGSFLSLTNGITDLVTDQLAPAEEAPARPPADKPTKKRAPAQDGAGATN